MTEQEKRLLLIDLSARLPYGVKCKSDVQSPIIVYSTIEKICKDVKGGFFVELKDRDIYGKEITSTSVNNFDLIKPYLRPMSSMTEDELYDWTHTWIMDNTIEKYDWLNKKHFDYRGLIPMGLAVEAPKDMYEIPHSTI